MSEKYAGPATSTCEHCHISEICYPFRWHRLSLAVLFVRGSIIVTACCMAHQTNLYLNYNEFRIISPELYWKFWDVRMHLRYCISFIGCRWSRVVYKLALITFKARAQSTPSYLHNLLTVHNCTRTLRSSDLPLLYIPRVRTVTAGRAFRAAASSIWNTLPRPVSSCDNIASFKRRLKTHLFTTVFKQSLHVI